MKISRSIIKIILGAILALLIIFLTLNSGYKIEVKVSDNPTINQPVKIDIQVSHNIEEYSPESLKIEIYNKYNKEDTLEYELTEISKGHYSLILTPNFDKDYIINVLASSEGDSFSETSSFIVEDN